MIQETRAANFASQTIWTGDNLDIMRGMNSDSVDLIYLDPPFNSKANYAAPIGSKAAGAAFKDTWGLDDVKLVWHGEIKHEYPGLYALLTATRDIHGASMMSYLIYMSIRIMEMRRLLKPDGSIYLHCDTTASHYLKLLMDDIFGKENYQNEITWQRTRGKGLNPTRYVQNCDRLLYYSRGKKRTWNQQYDAFEPGYGADWREDEYGKWQAENLTGGRAGGAAAYEMFNGVSPSAGRAWAPPVRDKFPPELQRRLPANYETLNQLEKCKALDEAGLIYWPKKRGGMPRYKKYLSTLKGRYASDLITDIPPISSQSKERTGYPTQKPLALLHRVVKASSNEGDMVLDPFCGCATTCIAAEQLQRNWVGIDISEKAADLVQSRLREEVGLMYQGAHRTDIPKRTDLGKIPRYNSAENRRYLYGEQGGYCNGCETHFEPRHLQVDHIVPRAKGGNDHISNLQLLCASCNAHKGKKSHEELIILLTDKGWIKRRKEVINGSRHSTP